MDNSILDHLILIKLAVLVLLFALVLKGDDDEADEDVDHKERDDNDVDEEKDGDALSVVVNWTHVLLVRVDAPIHQTAVVVSQFSQSYGVVTCEIKLLQNYFSFRRRPTEIILFQRVETCLKLFRNYFGGLLQLMDNFQHVQCR